MGAGFCVSDSEMWSGLTWMRSLRGSKVEVSLGETVQVPHPSCLQPPHRQSPPPPPSQPQPFQHLSPHLIPIYELIRSQDSSSPSSSAASKASLTEFTTHSDSSFAPGGRESQSGLSIHLTYGSVRHLIHWQSFKEAKMAESSGEAELYALSSAYKVARNFPAPYPRIASRRYPLES